MSESILIASALIVGTAIGVATSKAAFALGRSTERLRWLEKLKQIDDSGERFDAIIAFKEWVHAGYRDATTEETQP